MDLKGFASIDLLGEHVKLTKKPNILFIMADDQTVFVISKPTYGFKNYGKKIDDLGKMSLDLVTVETEKSF